MSDACSHVLFLVANSEKVLLCSWLSIICGRVLTDQILSSPRLLPARFVFEDLLPQTHVVHTKGRRRPQVVFPGFLHDLNHTSARSMALISILPGHFTSFPLDCMSNSDHCLALYISQSSQFSHRLFLLLPPWGCQVNVTGPFRKKRTTRTWKQPDKQVPPPRPWSLFPTLNIDLSLCKLQLCQMSRSPCSFLKVAWIR